MASCWSSTSHKVNSVVVGVVMLLLALLLTIALSIVILTSSKSTVIVVTMIMCVQVIDDGGSEHEVLLRSFQGNGQETMYLLDRLAPVLEQAQAQAGDMLMLTRDEGGPVVSLTPHQA